MKNKTILAGMLALCMTFSLAACGSSDSSSTEAATTEAVTETEAATEAEEETTEAKATTEAEETTEAETPAETEAVTETAVEAENGSEAAEATGSYVNFDDMCFYINGIKYTLGVSTLQDLIDDGVPFEEDDLANAGNNVNSNYQSSGFKIELGEYWTAQVYVLNDSDSGKTASECYINEVYLPVHTDETQDILTFDFPTDMTMEELTANAGEPDDSSHYDGDNGYYSDTYEYIKESETYYSDSEYTFEFTKGELTYITITYIP